MRAAWPSRTACSLPAVLRTLGERVTEPLDDRSGHSASGVIQWARWFGHECPLVPGCRKALKSIYETRVLAFVDLLGFSKLVLTSPSNAEAMAKVVGIMNLLFKFEQENYELLQNHAEDVSFFSNCVVLSGSIDRLWYIFREIGS